MFYHLWILAIVDASWLLPRHQPVVQRRLQLLMTTMVVITM
jgi:hypothetical protein